MIRWEYEANKQETEGLKKKIAKLQPDEGANGDTNVVQST